MAHTWPVVAMLTPSPSINKGLREHLLAAGASGSGPAPYPTASAPPPTTSDDPYRTSDTTSPQHDQYDQHTPGQAPYGMSGDSEELDGSPHSGKGGKRELSTSKRAAQNRAAQVSESRGRRSELCNG